MSCENDDTHAEEDYCRNCATCHACLDEYLTRDIELRLSLKEQNAVLVKELEAVKAAL